MRRNARKHRLMRTKRDFLCGGGCRISGKICRASVRVCPTSARLPHHGTFSKFKPNWWTLFICCFARQPCWCRGTGMALWSGIWWHPTLGESNPEEFQSDKSTQFGLRLTLPGCEANKRNGFALLAEEAEWSGVGAAAIPISCGRQRGAGGGGGWDWGRPGNRASTSLRCGQSQRWPQIVSCSAL